jgi:hypothetical protein
MSHSRRNSSRDREEARRRIGSSISPPSAASSGTVRSQTESDAQSVSGSFVPENHLQRLHDKTKRKKIKTRWQGYTENASTNVKPVPGSFEATAAPPASTTVSKQLARETEELADRLQQVRVAVHLEQQRFKQVA